MGDGQHGTARFASRTELRHTYKEIPFEPELWRKGKNRPETQGIVVACKEMMYSASRSRRLSIVSIIQSHQQLEKNYGREGAAIIIDNCQLTIAGGFAPGSESADIISKAMGSRTVMSGSVSRSKNDPSQYIVEEKGARQVSYVSKLQIEDSIVAKFPTPPSPKAVYPPAERRRMPPFPMDIDNRAEDADEAKSDSAGAEMTPSPRKRNMGSSQKLKNYEDQ